MKQLLFFALLGSLLFSSCGSDDDNVIGTWVITSFVTTSCDDPDDNGSESSFSTTPCTDASPDDCAYISYTFTESAITTVTSFTFGGSALSETESGTYTIDGDVITVCIDGECDPATFSIDGDNVTFTDTDPDDGCVTTISGTRQ